jgi:hypothetical protein
MGKRSNLLHPLYKVTPMNTCGAIYLSENSLHWCKFLGAFAKLRKVTISFVVSGRFICLSAMFTRFPQNGFLWQLVFEYFLKIRRENSSFFKIHQE